MRRILITTATLVVFLFSTQVAQAEPENPIIRGTLDVQVVGGGKITGTGIDCGTDCSDTASWRDNEMPPKNRLTATASHGWAFNNWTGCTSLPAQSNRCDAGYSEFGGDPVVASFIDVMAPSVFINGYSHILSNTMYVNVTTSDNDQVARVEFLLDGQVVGTRTSDYFNSEIDVSGVPEGIYQLQARSYDRTGNNGITASYEIEIDRTAPEVTFNSPVTATNAASPQFSFDSGSADFHHAECAIQKQGETDATSPCGRNEWYSEATPTEGVWEFAVIATDEAGNESSFKHEFVVDRTAPEAAFTSGPADGSVVAVGNVKYSWDASDSLALTQICAWDNGEATPCDGTASRGLTAGAHTFKVVIGDEAGNSTTLSRTVNVKKDGDTPPPDDEPDTTDRTAPVIKLIAPKQKVRSLRKALRLNVRCSEACSGKVVVKGKGVKFAGRVFLTRAGVAKLKLRPATKVRKRLVKLSARGRRALVLTASATLKDKAGNTGRSKLKFRIKD